MASGVEIRTTQKNALFDLLVLKKEMENEKDTVGYKGLHKLIIRMEAAMEPEDVAYVEKKIAEL